MSERLQKYWYSTSPVHTWNDAGEFVPFKKAMIFLEYKSYKILKSVCKCLLHKLNAQCFVG